MTQNDYECDVYDDLAYEFWSIHPRDISDDERMPKGYRGGIRAWHYAKRMREVTEGLCAVPDLLRLNMMYDSVDGAHRLEVLPVQEHEPAGKQQDCSAADGGVEWVDQHGPGMAGDDFWGTVTWKLGSYYVVVHYAT